MFFELVRYKCAKYHRKAHTDIDVAFFRDGLKLHAMNSTLGHILYNESDRLIGLAGISRGGTLFPGLWFNQTPHMTLLKNKKITMNSDQWWSIIHPPCSINEAEVLMGNWHINT